MKKLFRNKSNDAITEDAVIEMLSQHIITSPIFDALFDGYKFSSNNPMSKSIENVIAVLQQDNKLIGLDSDAQLDKFFDGVQEQVKVADTPYKKQELIIKLYDNFYKTAFPRLVEKHGIVYTPVQCVDFILHSVQDILKQEFNTSLGDKNVHILDPFTGTGTFITRLMKLGIDKGWFTKEQLKYKYQLSDREGKDEKGKAVITQATELHANEIMLLSYYIASINIENTYHDIMGSYESFEGICLTDTFQMSEADIEDLLTPLLEDNNKRRKAQQQVPIKVFIGNPPYSIGQKSGNDNNQNVKYKTLDDSIANSYAKFSCANSTKGCYDSYIKAIRWASNRIDQANEAGVIAYITNAGWLDSNSADGMRKCLQEEFDSIYVFNLRGAIRGKIGIEAKKEGQNVFDIMTGVAITVFVKKHHANKNDKGDCNIYYYDIGDYLSRQDKINEIEKLRSIASIDKWQEIQPDEYNDWIDKRDPLFYNHIAIGDKKGKNDVVIFDNYSLGLNTNRDTWIYNYGKKNLATNIQNMITFYNQELDRYSHHIKSNNIKSAHDIQYIMNFVNKDRTKFSWTSSLIPHKVANNVKADYSGHKLTVAIYRPFNKIWCYFDSLMNHRTGQLFSIFPEHDLENLVIGVTSLGAKKGFSAIINNTIVDLNYLEAGCQCFPLYLYEPVTAKEQKYDFMLFDNSIIDNDADSIIVTAQSGNKYKRKHAITDAGLKHFTDYYHDTSITKEDLFYYIYGILHSEQYKTKYKNNLTKSLPHIPRVSSIADFRAFEQAGRSLADLHINYETIEQYKVKFNTDIKKLSSSDFTITSMKFAKVKNNDTGKNENDKTTIIYNSVITISNIPLRAYDYVINGKSAIEWVIDRQCVSIDKESDIENNANDWAIETMNNPKYPLELLLRVITVSMKTLDIVENLPQLEL